MEYFASRECFKGPQQDLDTSFVGQEYNIIVVHIRLVSRSIRRMANNEQSPNVLVTHAHILDPHYRRRIHKWMRYDISISGYRLVPHTDTCKLRDAESASRSSIERVDSP